MFNTPLLGRLELTDKEVDGVLNPFRPEFQYITGGVVDIYDLKNTIADSFAWLNENATGRWHLDDKWDPMFPPLNIYIERKTDQDKFIEKFGTLFDYKPKSDERLIAVCQHLGLLVNPKDALQAWVKENEAFQQERVKQKGGDIYRLKFRSKSLEEKYLASFPEWAELKQGDTYHLPAADVSLTMMGMSARQCEFSWTVGGYRVKGEESLDLMKEAWGPYIDDVSIDGEGEAMVKITLPEPANQEAVLARYKSYLNGEIEWDDVVKPAATTPAPKPPEPSAF
ncbi:MAG: hypothetical protein DI551_02705 [Micavibrio aeruginosavorus]|uniref:Uncharacterized protein n=1 Tax=Micavibrio aeruginosavorus TaxID=349221 RepID=A0A2W5Q8F6_9BACT|nr:MAG: hypothetical protein DI551_02705 [Micavibrio aeruginosavorus]